MYVAEIDVNIYVNSRMRVHMYINVWTLFIHQVFWYMAVAACVCSKLMTIAFAFSSADGFT